MKRIALLVFIFVGLTGCGDLRTTAEADAIISAEAAKTEAAAAKRRADLAEKAQADQSKTIDQLKADIEADKGLITDANLDSTNLAGAKR